MVLEGYAGVHQDKGVREFKAEETARTRQRRKRIWWVQRIHYNKSLHSLNTSSVPRAVLMLYIHHLILSS